MIERQSTCVAIDGRALLIEGLPGTGKSSLALELIDRGAALVGDDSLILETAGPRLIARPHPRTRGLIEVRNLGLLPFPVCEEAPVSLVLILDSEAPRFLEAARMTAIGGIDLPVLDVWPGVPPLALKAELALARYGLSFD